MAEQKNISVIIPCYNHGQYLEEAIASTDYKNLQLQIIVIDDGSDDAKTKDVLEKVKQEGILVLHQENQGPSIARNHGLQYATGDYILLLDADNRITRDYIVQATRILDANPSVGIVYSDCYHFNDHQEKHVTLPPFSSDRLLAANFIDNCAFVRRTVFDQVGNYDSEMPMYGYEDWELWIRCWAHDVTFYHIQQPLFYYRLQTQSVNQQANQDENRKALFSYIVRKHKNVYQQNYEGVLMVLLSFVTNGERLVANLEQIKASLDHELHTSRQKTDELTDSLQEKEKELHFLSSKIVTLKTEIVDITKQKVHIEEQNAHINKLKDGLAEDLTNEKTKTHDLEQQVEKALHSIWKLQTRINNFEATKIYKLQKHINNFRNRLRSNASKKSRTNFFYKIIFATSRKGRQVIKKFLALIFKHLYLWSETKKVYIVESDVRQIGLPSNPYERWMYHNLPTESKLIQHKLAINAFVKRPTFSIIIPVYNPKIEHLKAAIDSVLNQVYENWELCIADDCSTDKAVKKSLKEYEKKEHRIKVVYRKENGHISAASNSALEIATGDYIVLMDQDDLITPDALYENAKVINENDQVDLIYSDEDKIDENGVHSAPHFKPDWSPDNLLSRNYLGHLTVFESSIFKKMGGWRLGFEGSQDYDVVLRFTEQTDAIYHIPKVLYHWRIHQASAAGGEDAKPYAYNAAKKALSEALVRRDEPGTVDFLDGFRGYSIRYTIKDTDQKVSIIIPTKDKTDILKTCIESIFEKTTYKNFEVIVVDNNSSEEDFFDYMKACEKKYNGQFKCIRVEIPFNFSTLVNKGAAASDGDYVLLLNNDTEVITPDWIEGMIEQAQRPSIGVVGVKLLYHNYTIQHAGVVIGLGGVAGHVLVGEDRYGPGYFNYVNMLNNYSALTAACVMVRRALWDDVNGFDEKFSVEYNDVDFCLRIREKGFHNIYVPHVELLHYESISRGHPHLSKESYERHLREIDLLKNRWMPYIEHDPCYNPNLTLGAHDFGIRI